MTDFNPLDEGHTTSTGVQYPPFPIYSDPAKYEHPLTAWQHYDEIDLEAAWQIPVDNERYDTKSSKYWPYWKSPRSPQNYPAKPKDSFLHRMIVRPRADFDLDTEFTGNRMPQQEWLDRYGGVRTTHWVNFNHRPPTNFRAMHIPGGWIFYWDYPEEYYSEGTSHAVNAARVLLRPIDERGSCRLFGGNLRSQGNGHPAGPWTCGPPPGFEPGQVFDAILQVESKFDCGPIVGPLPVILTEAKPPPPWSGRHQFGMQVWNSRWVDETMFPGFEPLTETEIDEITQDLIVESNSLAVRANIDAIRIPASDVQIALTGAGLDYQFKALDRNYTAVQRKHLTEFLAADLTEDNTYQGDAYDIDNYAFALCASAGLHLGNSCGMILDRASSWAYNVFLVHDEGAVTVVLVDPEADQIMSGPVSHTRESGIIFWP